ncbi:LysM peptidoglycan-binding domain-containing protein [Chitinophaga horti]|uniref:LysM peptidoglycan-binding domain-containing protein n=1 Tax=Chitinophaga horti TaxID=2920382 RepID=A0ABY6J3A6_9BACT|nr:LysM peptidoglycan-binding domain-containing protein [Chitinophaga horti]UYQ93985.1 LysM peptidoglycan-binding domain-containing protein [Chitinophaga horti]
MLKSVMFGVLLTCSTPLFAQDTLLVQGSGPDLHVVHTVKKGENFYSLSRAYGLPPKEIAAKNHISMEQGLQLGQKINIPLSKTNFSQGKDIPATGYRPVYHVVTEKETLYRISTNYNKVAIDNIRQWNNFSGDGVKKDAYLVVGWVKGAGAAPVMAKATPAATAAPATPVAPPPPPVETTAPVTAPVTPPPAEGLPPVPIVGDAAPVKETPKTEAPKTEAPKTETPKESAPVVSNVILPAPPDESFERIYDQQTEGGRDVTSEKGPGTWFRANAQNKYYALHKSAPRGTIIKVTNPLNGRSVYAKVLDAIPQSKGNAGVIVKLSNSAQEALGITEARFFCELHYEGQ